MLPDLLGTGLLNTLVPAVCSSILVNYVDKRLRIGREVTATDELDELVSSGKVA
ncbi:MAG TPA: hypothetical protein VJT49_10675 [Amycolatopsis sp.]|uniref:hypothetical protein n=1 Tax=Amycolatopsis sp. TaxID=37632 RepID=UPI002B45B56B|nr:hypothetical protein [Amycolatopsis sp.]HKS45558.1 hypothetical protein [Amycolatopsis sp.]